MVYFVIYQKMEKTPFILKKNMIFDFSAKINYDEFVEKFNFLKLSFNLTISNADDSKIKDKQDKLLRIPFKIALKQLIAIVEQVNITK